MPKVRINDLARDLEVKSKEILDALPLVGVTEKKSHSSSVEDWEAEKVRVYFRAQGAAEQGITPHPHEQADFADSARRQEESATAATVDIPSGLTMSTPILDSQNRTAGEFPEPPPAMDPSILKLPDGFSFYTPGFVHFDHVLRHFDWNLSEKRLTIDLSLCARSNYQSLALLVQYAWYLTLNGCAVTFKYGTAHSGSTRMLTSMGALDWRDVLLTDGRDFTNEPRKKTYALRRRSDVQSTINNVRRAIRLYSIGFPEYMSYIISELLYNATEHGRRSAAVANCQVAVPMIFQFGLYPQLNRLSFLFSDLGVGIKSHLEQSYPPFPTHQDAMIYALRPSVSGTFQQGAQPYSTGDNAGMGLTYSSQMLKRLNGDMYIVSHNGVVHVSPEDVTSHQLKNSWPGTFVLINLDVGSAPTKSLQELMSEIRINAQKELDGATKKEGSERYVVSVVNYFGKYAEDKDAAITFRDRHLIPAIEQGKRIDLDFQDVQTAPHSFLNALLSIPVRKLGVKAYQWVRVYNAPGPIHEIVQKVIEDNLPRIH